MAERNLLIIALGTTEEGRMLLERRLSEEGLPWNEWVMGCFWATIAAVGRATSGNQVLTEMTGRDYMAERIKVNTKRREGMN